MKVYIAGPISLGDQALNVRRALEAGARLLEAGHIPFVPHLSWCWHMVCPQEYETWLAWDQAWLDVCDALIRLPGESAGADREVVRARELGIPVYRGVEEFLTTETVGPWDWVMPGREE